MGKQREQNVEKNLFVTPAIGIWHSDLQKIAHSAATVIRLTLKNLMCTHVCGPNLISQICLDVAKHVQGTLLLSSLSLSWKAQLQIGVNP